MKYKKLTDIIFFIFIFITFFSFEDEAIILSVNIDPATVYIDEEFKIIVTVESNKPIKIEEMPSLDKIYPVRQIKQPEIDEQFKTSFLNYRIYAKYITTIIFYLISEEEVIIQGSSLKFKINNKYHIIKDFYIPIISKTNSFLEENIQNFISIKYEPKDIFIGLPFIIEYDIFSKYNIDKIEIMELPLINGAVFQKIEYKNDKEQISIFDEVINKYVILKLMVFPSSTNVVIDKFNIKISHSKENLQNQLVIPIAQKKINVNPIPQEDPDFFGLIGNYSVSYNFNRFENDNLIFYFLEINFSGKGNHKYVNFEKLKLNQQYFNIFGPDISYNEDSVILDYYLYPKQTGFIYLNQISIPIFNPEKREMIYLIIPRTYFYITQNLEQIFSSFNFSNKTIGFSNNKINGIYDILNFLEINIIFLIFFLLTIFLLTFSFFIKFSDIENKKPYIMDNDFILFWTKIQQKYKISNYDEFIKLISKLDSKNKNFLINSYKIYCGFFNSNNSFKNNKLKSKELKRHVKKLNYLLRKKII